MTARDALIAINHINAGHAYLDHVDTNGDGVISSIDVLGIVRHLNRQDALVDIAMAVLHASDETDEIEFA